MHSMRPVRLLVVLACAVCSELGVSCYRRQVCGSSFILTVTE